MLIIQFIYPLTQDQRLNCAFIVGLSLLLPYIFRNQRLVEKTVRVLKQLDLTAGEYFNTVESPAWHVALGIGRARVLANCSTVTLYLKATFQSALLVVIIDGNGPHWTALHGNIELSSWGRVKHFPSLMTSQGAVGKWCCRIVLSLLVFISTEKYKANTAAFISAFFTTAWK